MEKSALEAQIAKERRELANAPTVAFGATIPRCHFCGKIVKTLTRVERIGEAGAEAERFKGECCNGYAG